MKFTWLIVFSSILILTCCSKEFKEHPNFSLLAKQTGYKVDTYGKDSISLYGITLELRPKYDTLTPIYLMTCAWGTRNAMTNDSLWFVGYHPCDANFMSIYDLDSGEYLELKTVAINMKLFNNTEDKSFRIGIAIVDTLDYSYSEFFDDMMTDSKDKFKKYKTETDRIVWSNEIIVEELNTEEYHFNGTVREKGSGI